ncbi:MAG: protein kinase [bacterium]|nr:protein kinase [bacterium]
MNKTTFQAGSYRCVCGELVPLKSDPIKCLACSRIYDAQVVRSATAETVILDGDDEAAVIANATQSHEPDLFVGKKVGHYRIIDCLGHGGMGKVYRALDESLQRYVAVKVINPGEGSTGEADLRRLFDEARAQARVNHAHVAHIYYVGFESETPFLAMELVGEETLADRLTKGPIPFSKVVRFGQQIVDALEHALRFDILHRDIKPSNILLVHESAIKLADFGMAQRVSKTKTANDSIAGTPNYMAPESTRGQPADFQSDMYSLGVTLFEMTFGRLPYPDVNGDISQRLRQHRESKVEFPEVWPAETPAIWRGVLEKLLAKDPADRYADYAALAADLRRIEPVTRPRANIVLRGFAVLVDWLLVVAVFVSISSFFNYFLPASLEAARTGVFPAEVEPIFLLSLVGIWIQGSVLAAVAMLQLYWGTTPGKRLFQIRIADRHGYRPASWVLAVRTFFQFLWAWSMLAVFLAWAFFGVDIMPIRSLLVAAFILVEIAFIAFNQGLSLHDRLLGTQVVLDAAPADFGNVAGTPQQSGSIARV